MPLHKLRVYSVVSTKVHWRIVGAFIHFIYFTGAGTTTTTPSLFGTNQTQSLFPQPTAAAAPSLFGGGGATTGFGTGLFGSTATTSAPSLFGTGFGTSSGTTGGFGGFGTTSGGTSFGGFGTQQAGASLFGKPVLPQTGEL